MVHFTSSLDNGHILEEKNLEMQIADLDKDGRLILLWACAQGRINIVKHLFCASTNIKIDATELFHLAVANSHLDIIQFLVEEEGVDVTHDGNKALKKTVRRGNIDIVRYLISQGADVESCETEIRLSKKHTEIMKLLISLNDSWAIYLNK